MKFFALLLVILTMNVNLSAQLEFNGAQDDYFGVATNTTEEVDAAWGVTNTSDQVLTLRVKRYVVEEVEGTDSNFCWGFLCIPWTSGDHLTASEEVMINPGMVDNSFRAKYRHMGHAGNSVFDYCFVDMSGTYEPVCHRVTYSVDGTVSVGNTEDIAGEISLFPNPIENTATISYNFKSVPFNGKLIIHGMMGAKVKEIAVNNRAGVVYLGAADFAPGVYFCSLEDNGQVYQTIRMVIQ